MRQSLRRTAGSTGQELTKQGTEARAARPLSGHLSLLARRSCSRSPSTSRRSMNKSFGAARIPGRRGRAICGEQVSSKMPGTDCMSHLCDHGTVFAKSGEHQGQCTKVNSHGSLSVGATGLFVYGLTSFWSCVSRRAMSIQPIPRIVRIPWGPRRFMKVSVCCREWKPCAMSSLCRRYRDYPRRASSCSASKDPSSPPAQALAKALRMLPLEAPYRHLLCSRQAPAARVGEEGRAGGSGRGKEPPQQNRPEQALFERTCQS